MKTMKSNSFYKKISPSQFFEKKFITFVAIGFSNFIISYSIFWISINYLIEAKYKAFISQLLSYTIATVWSFYWNKKYTFKSNGPIFKEGAKFIILQGFLAVTSSFFISLGADVFDFNPTLTWFVVMSVITIANFLLSKWWAFGNGDGNVKE